MIRRSIENIQGKRLKLAFITLQLDKHKQAGEIDDDTCLSSDRLQELVPGLGAKQADRLLLKACTAHYIDNKVDVSQTDIIKAWSTMSKDVRRAVHSLFRPNKELGAMR